MKEGWTYKKLGEVATIIGGSTPKSNIEEYWGGTHYWVTPADLDGNKYQGATPRTITDLAVQKTNLQLLPIGTVLLSSRAPIGKVAITTAPMYCNQGFKNIVCSNLIINEFVYWYLFGKVDYLNSLGRGATFKEISKRATEQIPIPVPPLAEQERIVAELDLLSGIIEKKKEQLKAYDQLAQSIFYTMFGDPIDNPKGWEVKKIGDVCEPKSQIKRASKCFAPNEQIRYIDISSINNSNNTITSMTPFLFSEAPSRAQQKVERGDILVSLVRPNLKNVAIVKDTEKNCVASSGFCVLRSKANVFSSFIFTIVTSDFFTEHLIQRVSGANYPAVKEDDIKDFILPIPPLSLQQEFAEKVEAIERQKALVQQSIEEMQTMFDYTMDKYFG